MLVFNQKKMKNIRLLILSITILLSANGCNDKLDLLPNDFLVPQNYFNNKNDLNSSLTSVYNALNEQATYSDFYQYMYSGTDESIINTRLTENAVPATYTANANSVYIASLWSTLYEGINRANLLLENIDKPMGVTDKERNIIKGETLFLRAYYYFMLTQWFGDIPLKLNATKNANADIAFTSSKNVYDFIINEMTTAEDLLVNQQSNSLLYNERVTQTVVQGILARVCLYAAGEPLNDTRRYADALAWAKKVQASGQHSLNPDFQQVFINHSADLYDNTYRESMWDVSGVYVPSLVSLREGTNSRVEQTNTNNILGQGSGFARSTAGLYYAYEDGDLRRDWTLVPYRYTGGNAVTLPTENYYTFTDSKWERESGKWRRKYEMQLPRNQNSTPKNVPIIRYADVLLMLAEAEYKVNGATSIATNAVNEVRRRAFGITRTAKAVSSITIVNGGSGYTTTPIITFTGGTRIVRPDGPYGALPNVEPRATVTISGGRITRVNLLLMGEGYLTPPTVVISGTNQTASLRAELVNSADLSPSQSTGVAFEKIIRDERLKELAFEILRRQDLKRWGILIPTVKNIANEVVNGSAVLVGGLPLYPGSTNTGVISRFILPGNNISNKDLFLPIPSVELTYNKLAKQNSGF
jgi:hypothetical protein